jgi:hypothetical protein
MPLTARVCSHRNVAEPNSAKLQRARDGLARWCSDYRGASVAGCFPIGVTELSPAAAGTSSSSALAILDQDSATSRYAMRTSGKGARAAAAAAAIAIRE